MTRPDYEAKLVDYLLGELGVADQAKLEQALAADPELRKAADELRKTIGLVTAAGESDRLTDARRAAVLQAAAAPSPAPVSLPPKPKAPPLWLGKLSVAALVLIALGATITVFGQKTARLFRASTESLDRGRPMDSRASRKDQVLTEFTLTDMESRANAGQFQIHGITAGDTDFHTEEYSHIVDNGFLRVLDQPLSTFSIDVDTAAYANTRRFLTSRSLPPADAVRIEELLNYFRYDYRKPSGHEPFAVNLEVHAAPWQPKHRLVRIGLQGREIAQENRPVSNLVFLLDVSGSMNEPDKLPLVKRAMTMLVDQLGENDHVAMVVYAGSSGVVLPPTSGLEKARIIDALERLQAGGSTNGGQGIQLAYRLAEENFVKGGCNRVILCTDGDFNVGVSSEGELVRLIEEKRKSGVFLSVLGFGTGNYADARMQQLADKGNGNASYIDSLSEARKVLVEEMSGTLVTIAKDVKIQVEFNPAKVAAYRLIGYENRMLAAQDFNDDAKDAGEIGAGHQVTALYEVVPAGQEVPGATVDPLKYQKNGEASAAAAADELFTIKLRWKEPEGETSDKIEIPFTDPASDTEAASADFDFASAVAAFGMLLRNSEHKGQASWDLAIELATEGLAFDPQGYRKECLELMRTAKALSSR